MVKTMEMYKWVPLNPILFLEMEILPAFLLAPHPQENFGCDSKKQ